MSHSELFDIKMNRKGFGLRSEIRTQVKDVYHSDVIHEIKANGFSKAYGRVTFHLAKQFGFCYGVDRAVEMAYETRQYFPDKRIFLTTEIIHNPTVNQNLVDLGVRFLSGSYQNASHDEITADDVVIVPAFGSTVQELKSLHDKGCQLVDTICGSVVTVWKRVERYAQEGFTSIIHGKYNHEETQATSSRVTMFPNAHYLIVLSEKEAQMACDYLLHGGDKDQFMKHFAKSTSPGFDPDLHLEKVGLANQTTMLSSESLRIAEMFKKALIQKYSESDISDHYMSFDTICSATQERQDAIIELKDKKPDIILVVGGFNSSNTTHLQELAMTFSKSFHIDGPQCLLSDQEIQHQPFGSKTCIIDTNWLPQGNFSVAITAGASTPNSVMGDVIQKVIQFSNQPPLQGDDHG